MLNTCKVRRNTRTREIDQVVIDRPFTDERANVIYNYYRSVGIPIHLGKEAMRKELKKRGFNVDLEVAAWHGSPHYIQGGFRTDRIGTGEGNKAHGWGLYFSDLREVGKWYADRFATLEIVNAPKDINDDLNKIFTKIKSLYIDKSGYTTKEALESFLSMVPQYTAGDRYVRDEDKQLLLDLADKVLGYVKDNYDTIEIKAHRNLYKVTLHKGKTPDQYTWLYWDKEVPNIDSLLSELNKVSSVKIDKNYFKDKKAVIHTKRLTPILGREKTRLLSMLYSFEFTNVNEVIETLESYKDHPDVGERSIEIKRILEENLDYIESMVDSITGQEFYDVASKILGSDKEASLFLLKNGIDGVKVPVNYNTSFESSEDSENFNYVVFDENAITIEEHIQFLSTPSGEVYGFVTPEGEMFLDPDIAGVNTLIHEGAHIQYKVLKTAAERGDVKAQAILNKIQELTAPAVETIFNAKKAQERGSDSTTPVDMQTYEEVIRNNPNLDVVNIVQEEGLKLFRWGNWNYFKNDPSDTNEESTLRDSVEDVDISKIVTIDSVSESRLEQKGEYIKPKYDEYYTGYPVAIRLKGSILLLDGHHRLELAKRAGESTIKVAIKDLQLGSDSTTPVDMQSRRKGSTRKLAVFTKRHLEKGNLQKAKEALENYTGRTLPLSPTFEELESIVTEIENREELDNLPYNLIEEEYGVSEKDIREVFDLYSKKYDKEVTKLQEQSYEEATPPRELLNIINSPAYNQRENETDEQYRERLIEEVYATALGSNGEQYLKDLGFTAQEAKTFLQKVQEFLAEIVDWLRGKKGLQDLSVDEINRLSIREFLDRSTTSMMLGEFKDPSQTSALTPNREVQVYITPATVRSFNEETLRLKELSAEYNKVAKEISQGNLENQERFTILQNEILDTYQEHIQDKVSKIRGVNVSFNQPYLGSWEGIYEPSLNMTLSISPNADTGAISGLLFDLAENTSQDAFILEERSEIEGRIPLTEFDEAGMTHYPQIRVIFDKQLTVEEKSIVAQRLISKGIDDFSIDGDYFIASILDFKSKTNKQKEEFYDKKHAAITTLFSGEGEKVGKNKVKDIQEHIRKSRYVTARNAGDKQSQTRGYDRSDLFEAQSPNIIPQISGEQELQQPQIAIQRAIQRNNGHPLHLAPNGQPSNLYQSYRDLGYTEQQAEELTAQVYSDNFLNWFGDWINDPQNSSKVVDSNGQPMLMYHGSPSIDIEVFDRSKSKATSSGLKEFGDFFTSNRRLANLYRTKELSKEAIEERNFQIRKYTELLHSARNNKDFDIYNNILNSLKEGRVYTTFLNIRTPLEGDAKGMDYDAWSYMKLDIGYKTARGRGDVLEAISGNNTAYDSPFDGALIHNMADMLSWGKDVSEYIGTVAMTLEPNQIKSATDNVGTFSSESNNINFQISGEQGGVGITTLNEVAQQLQKTGLAKKVHTLSPQQIEQELIKRGVDSNIIGDRQIQFQKAGLGLLPNGFVDLNTREVFLNKETANLDTPIHEFTHLYNRALKQNNPELYQRGIDLVNQELEKELSLSSVESTAKALEGVDTQPLKKQLGIEANWDMIGEGDVLSGKDPVLAYTQRQLPDWYRESQKGNINPNSKITYDIYRQAATPTKTLPSGYVLEGRPEMVNKEIAYAKDENGVIIGMVEIETLKDGKNGIRHIAVAPEFRGKGVADKLIQTLKDNNPELDLSKTKLRSKGFEKAFGNKIISEAYHKAKADGSNPELVKAVEELIGKSEIQEVIDYVKTTQPNLKDEALAEEILTELTGRRGIELLEKHGDKKSGIIAWLKEAFEAIKQMLGLSQMSNEQAMNLTLQEYADAVATDLLRGEELKFENEAQEYFTREADRLPLTLAVFNTKPFQDLQGKQVKPVTIQQLLNKSGIKQIEKDLINQVLSDNYSGQKRIDYDEFEATVRANIMPLERITTTSYADYGMDNLGDGNYGEAKTLILNSPIEHGVTGHFSGAFRASGRKNIKYVPKQLNDNTWIAVEEGYERQANENNIYQFVGTAGTKEAVDLWIIKYDLSQGKIFDNKKYLVYQDAYDQVDNVLPLAGFDTEQEAKDFIEQNRDNYSYNLDYVDEQYLKDRWNLEQTNKGMFGHIRVWQDGQNFYVAELQSDYFQKNNARRDVLAKNKQYREIQDKIKNKNIEIARKEGQIDSEKHKEDSLGWENYAKNILESDKYLITYEDSLTEDMFKEPITKVEIREQDNTLVYSNVFKRGSHYDINNPNYEDIPKFIGGNLQLGVATNLINSARSKNIIFKTENENVKSLEGELRILKDELKQLNKNLSKTADEIIKNLPKDQKQFLASQKEWEKRMVREVIKEASLSGATSLRFPTPYTLSVIEGYVAIDEEDNAKLRLREAIDGDIIDYLDSEYIVMYTDVPNGGTEVQIAPVRELAKITYEEFQDMIEEDSEPDTYVESSDGNFVYYTYSIYNITEIIDTKDITADKDSFSIEDDLSDTQQTVARKYEQIAEILKQERGEENVEIVTDENGFDWYETKITPEESQQPVVAFQVTEEIGASDNRSSQTQGFFSDVVTGASDRFKPNKPYQVEVQYTPKQQAFEEVYSKHRGNFDEHIATSIPRFRETQVQKGTAISAVISQIPDAKVLDIGGSEGSFVKSITEVSGAQSINLEPNPDMAESHRSTPVTGSEVVQEAFYEGFGDVQAYRPTDKFDVVHESMVFQFITSDRVNFVKEVVNNYLKEGGLFITEEKLKTGEQTYIENEIQKDTQHKSKYYDESQLKTKAEEILGGMNENQASAYEYLSLLRENFDYVGIYWNSGNFYGIVATNSKEKFNHFMREVGDTTSEYTKHPIGEVTDEVIERIRQEEIEQPLTTDTQGVQVLEYQGSTLSYKQRVNPITNQPTNQIEIDLISVPQENRRQGHARELLRRMTEIADSRGQELYLFAAPRDRTTTTEGLIKLYKEFGFESISSFLPEEMVRPARRDSQRAEESLPPAETLLTVDLDGVQEYVPADKIITYYSEMGEINYKENSEGELVMLKTISATPQQEESITYKQLLSIPNLSKEQALEAYKNLYSTDYYDWKNKTNEC